MSIRDVLAQELPRAALAILAAKRGGAAGLSGFMQGTQQAQAQQQQLQRQAQQDEEQRAYRAQQMALQQSQESRLASSEARDARLGAINALQERFKSLLQTAPDAETGERQAAADAAQMAQITGIEPDLLMSSVPSMGPQISMRKAEKARIWAKGVMDTLETASRTKASQGLAIDDSTVSLPFTDAPEAVQSLAVSQGHQVGDPFKFSEIAALAGLPSFRTQPKPSATPNTPEEQFYATYAAEKGTTWERLSTSDKAAARRQWAQADDKSAANAADVTSLTPEGLDMAAVMYRKTGTLPPLGMGDKTTRQRILNRAAGLTAEDISRIELGGADIAGNQASYRADRASLAAMQKQRDAITSFEQTASKNIDIFLQTAGKIVDTGSPLANRVARAVGGDVLGSPNIAAYNAARQVAINEVAKIVSNPNMTGVLSDTARREVEAFNPSTATLAQTVAVMRILKRDMANRAGSLDSTLADIRRRIGGGGVQSPSPPPAAPTAGATYQDYLRSRGQ